MIFQSSLFSLDLAVQPRLRKLFSLDLAFDKQLIHGTISTLVTNERPDPRTLCVRNLAGYHMGARSAVGFPRSGSCDLAVDVAIALVESPRGRIYSACSLVAGPPGFGLRLRSLTKSTHPIVILLGHAHLSLDVAFGNQLRVTESLKSSHADLPPSRSITRLYGIIPTCLDLAFDNDQVVFVPSFVLVRSLLRADHLDPGDE
ncbi:hypothetical protein B0H11DRAFT_2222603 [Mycena galericulata]|nr:hypothetical protein B0H11DRAFT_2222603 [Mycena galericulata]